MRYERILELEDKEFTDKLFKNAVFKGGGSGGGGSTTQTVTEKSDPWTGQQPYLTDVFSKAQARYNQVGPTFYPGSTIESFNPLEQSYQNQVVDYTLGGRPQAMQMGAENAINAELFNPSGNPIYQATRGLAPYATGGLNRASALSGEQVLDDTNASPLMKQMLSGSVQQNPFIQSAIDNFATDAVSNFQNKVMPAMRSSQIAYQPGGSSRGDIQTGLATGQLARSIADFSNQSYMDAFNSAQAQQMQSAQMLENARARRANEALQQGNLGFNAGLSGERQIQGGLGMGLDAYSTASQTPIDFLGNLADVGLMQRELAQQQLDEAVNRHAFEQNIEDQKLRAYSDIVRGNFGSSGVQSQTRGGGGLAGSLAEGAGAVSALAGLLG